ncbi:MAG: rod shape-determining protein RodA [Patescibacteria group bacterium]|nr:rod shape-determining protein RodA [Patescibacteria group bacterium]
MINFFSKWQRLDWLLFFAVLILLALSASILYSLGLNTDSANFLVFRKQILAIFLALFFFFVFAAVNYKVWLTYSKFIYILFALVLLAVLFFGREIKGTTGWFDFGWFSVQPVEFAKIAMIIFLARYFSNHASEFYMFKHIFLSGLAVLFFVGLVMLQPDLGSAMVLIGVWLIFLLFTGIKKNHFLLLFFGFIAVSLISWFFLFQPYQQSRILTFIDPDRDPRGEGYNVIQSMVAVGSGQIFGRGLSLGSQSSLRFLPEPGTDFIFAVIAEELGLVGVSLLLFLFVFIFYRLFLIMKKSQDDFGSYFILGLAAMLLIQVFVNIGMNMGIAPVTGIPLPMVSAGGSSLLAVLLGLGIVQNINIRNN